MDPSSQMGGVMLCGIPAVPGDVGRDDDVGPMGWDGSSFDWCNVRRDVQNSKHCAVWNLPVIFIEDKS